MMTKFLQTCLARLVFTLILLSPVYFVSAEQPSNIIDIATQTTQTGHFQRVSGSVGNGHFGVPVAGGFDVNNDGFNDYMFSAMRASPLGRNNAGQVHFILGDGTINGSLDTAISNPRIINIYGDGQQENTGSEIWMDDVTGDGLGDLLIARQNFDAGSRPGAGALTIIPGSNRFETVLADDHILDLRNPPTGLSIFTITGAEAGDRLGIWMRTGDVDGDGINDLVVGADQDDGINNNEPHSGSVYLIRGGHHLDATQTVDLARFGNTRLAGNIARILPPAGSVEYHFGSTCQIADLDGNGRAEVLSTAALNRVGTELLPLTGGEPTHSSNGLPEGTVFIVWDNAFPSTAWPQGMTYRFGTNPSNETIINGAAENGDFGEELLGGLDYDNDQQPDLFIGDLSGQGNGLSTSGIGYVFYKASMLKGLDFDMQTPPDNLDISRFNGGFIGGIGADTAMHGDFDGDGIADLAFSSPHGVPLGRADAGIIHVFHGRNGRWPSIVDLRTGQLPPQNEIRITEIFGAHGTTTNDTGDVLSYSGAVGDIDKDGRDDFITNEMVGNGVAANTVDVGNLILISGQLLTGVAVQPPVNLNPVEGLWWNPLRPGGGFDIELTGNNDLIMIWYTYNEQTRARWYLASGAFLGNIWTADLFQFSWDGSQAIPNQTGVVTLVFQDQTHATLNWQLKNNQGAETIELFQFGTNKFLAGTWYEPALSGYGLTQTEQNSTQVKVLYFYDSAGNPVWVLGTANRTDLNVPMAVYSGACPACLFTVSQALPAGTVNTVFNNELEGQLSTSILLPAPYSGQWLIDNVTIRNLSE